MHARLVAPIIGCLVCCLFPAVVIVMVATYEQKGGWGEPGPFPYNAVDYIFVADLFYTVILILAMRTRCMRIVVAFVSIPLLLVTAVDGILGRYVVQRQLLVSAAPAMQHPFRWSRLSLLDRFDDPIAQP